MKYYHIISLTCILLVGVLVIIGCKEDEELNLVSYPDNFANIVITDVEDPASVVTINAVYDIDGTLLLDKEIPRNFSFRLHTPSPEEAQIKFSPYTENIPDELLNISLEKSSIPVGNTDVSVDVTLNEEEFLEMAKLNYEAEIYEFGLKAEVEGYRMGQAASIGKVVINKSAYLSTCFLDTEAPETFIRNYVDGQIVNAENITQRIKVALDRPAQQDVKILLDAVFSPVVGTEFLDDIIINNGENVIIPAGQTSVEFDWVLKHDFLCTNDEQEFYSITLLLGLESEDDKVVLDRRKKEMTLTVEKVVKNLEWTPSLHGYNAISSSGWSATITPEPTAGNGNGLVDRKENNGPTFWAPQSVTGVIDMQSNQSVSGIEFVYNTFMTEPNPIQKGYFKYMQFKVSTNGKDWVDLGNIDVEETDWKPNYRIYFKLLSPASARYLQFIVSPEAGKRLNLAIGELRIYKKE